jgi:hypothetical protein
MVWVQECRLGLACDAAAVPAHELRTSVVVWTVLWSGPGGPVGLPSMSTERWQVGPCWAASGTLVSGLELPSESAPLWARIRVGPRRPLAGHWHYFQLNSGTMDGKREEKIDLKSENTQPSSFRLG